MLINDQFLNFRYKNLDNYYISENSNSKSKCYCSIFYFDKINRFFTRFFNKNNMIKKKLNYFSYNQTFYIILKYSQNIYVLNNTFKCPPPLRSSQQFWRLTDVFTSRRITLFSKGDYLDQSFRDKYLQKKRLFSSNLDNNQNVFEPRI